jgi:glycosyltransferase involved in cell wall biosynthesis
MPLYNKRAYVKRSIDSVRNQTYENWELIIVDDGSTDGSSSQVPTDDDRIRLFRQTNAGPSAARNNGISKARGEFVSFLDADDYYYANKLEVEKTYLFEERKADWMMSAFEYEKNNSTRLRSIRDFQDKEVTGQPVVFDNAIIQLTMRGWHINGLCINKDLLVHLGGFRESMRCFEIADLLVRCALVQPRVLIYPFPLYLVLDVPKSAFKILPHRTEGSRQMGENLYELSTSYPELSHILTRRSKGHLYSYLSALIKSGKGSEARNYLTKNFPYSYNKRWLKMWVLSWLPQWLLQLKEGVRKGNS